MQLLEERARDLEIFGFKSLREAVIDESKIMASLIPLPGFGKKAGQVNCRSQLPSERRLRTCNLDCLIQAIYRRFAIICLKLARAMP